MLLALPLSIVGRHFQKQYDLLSMGNEGPNEAIAQGQAEPGMFSPPSAPATPQHSSIDTPSSGLPDAAFSVKRSSQQRGVEGAVASK